MLQAASDFLTYCNTGGDERTFDLLLMTPGQAILITIVYIVLVTVIGPKFMKNRKPYSLKYILILYNAIQVAINLYIFIMVSHPWVSDIRTWVQCQPIPPPDDPTAHKVIAAHHIYYLNKYIELLDTVFFVLRKKYNQVSFLHIYHHSTMPFLSCIMLRFAPASSFTFVLFLNTIIHVIMYGYYLLAALGPQFQKYLTWKKYLTSLQLVQFVTFFVHYVIVVFSGEPCNIPTLLLLVVIYNTVANFILFMIFYKRSYTSKNKEANKGINNGNMPIRKDIKSS